MPVPVLYQDPFAPVLLSSSPAVVSDEQKMYVREVLEIACSDSRFAEKAYVAITRILAGVSVVTSLSPGSATIGDPAFDMHVHGTGFTQDSVIYFNGLEEPTTYHSATDVSTGINMPLWLAPATVPVAVLSKDGVLSNAVNFVFQAAPEALSAKVKEEKTFVQAEPKKVK